MMQDLIINAVKPHIKPAFENAEKDILKIIDETEKKFFPEQNKEVAFFLAKHNGRILIIPAVIIDDESTGKQFVEIVSEDIQKELITPQPVVNFLISNFIKVLKEK